MTRRVVIVQRSLRQYRVPFLEALRERLDGGGVQLAVIQGAIPSSEEHRGDPGTLPWAHRVRPMTLTLGQRRLMYQPVIRRVAAADLVIVEQAARLVENYLLLLRQRVGGPPVALWGHGESQDTSPVATGVKRRLSRLPHWWFAYNDLAADHVTALGYPRERITIVNNSSDTRHLRALVDDVADDDVAATRRRLGIAPDAPVVLFVGSLSALKAFPFLFAAMEHVRRRIPTAVLLVVGDGEERATVEQLAEGRPWAQYLGRLQGSDLATVLRAADVLAVPGWAGLVVTDAFAAGVPIVASGSHPHPPEISYLDGHNGVVAEDGGDPVRYGDALVQVLTDDDQRRQLARGAREMLPDLTVEAMADRFAEGVQRALALPSRR